MGTSHPKATLSIGGVNISENIWGGVHQAKLFIGGFLGSHIYYCELLPASHFTTTGVLILLWQLYETEAKRRIKKEPALAMEPTQKKWFIDEEGEEESALVDRIDSLWSFSWLYSLITLENLIITYKTLSCDDLILCRATTPLRE